MIVVLDCASILIGSGHYSRALRLRLVCTAARQQLEQERQRLERLLRGWAAHLVAAQNVSGNLGQVFTQHDLGSAVGPVLPTSGRFTWTIQHANPSGHNALGVGLSDLDGSFAYALLVNMGRWMACTKDPDPASYQWRMWGQRTPGHAALGVPVPGKILLHNDGPPSNRSSSYQLGRVVTAIHCFLDADDGRLYMQVNDGPAMCVFHDMPPGSARRPFVATAKWKDEVVLAVPGPIWPTGNLHAGDL
jgi:hypothetical protein